VSTAVIFSIFSLVAGCDLKYVKGEKPNEIIKFGLQSDLLSFDPFSFQALGEKNTIELLYDRLIYFENNNLKSDLDVSLKIVGRSVVISGIDAETSNKINNIFSSARSSILWKDLFNPFDFKASTKKTKTYLISYNENKNFISNLKSISPLLVVKGDELGSYKIEKFQKGIKVKLVKNLDKKNSNHRIEKIMIRKVKSMSDGLKAVSQNEVDVFIPLSPSSKGDTEPYKDLIFSKSTNKLQKLRLYSKYNEKLALKNIFCSNKKEFTKVLEKSWRLSNKSCFGKKISGVSRDLKIIMGSEYGKQILDLLNQLYLKHTGYKIEYKILDGLKLSEALRSGDFDLYLSIDVESSSLPVLFDSFHSNGRYNSLQIKDPKLDHLLEKASKAATISDFNLFEKQAGARLKKISPFIFEYFRPHVEFVVHKNNNLKFVKSSKKLMKFQKQTD